MFSIFYMNVLILWYHALVAMALAGINRGWNCRWLDV